MSKGLLDILTDKIINSIFDDEWKGRRGEALTERELKIVKFFGRDGKILRNVYLPKDNGETSEIDVLYITKKGIFVFESKNYSGWIFGDEKSSYWTCMLPNREKNRFYNPIKQNATHIKWLKNYLNMDIPLFSIIAFSKRCELKKIPEDKENIRIIKRDWTYETIRVIWDKSPDVLSSEDVENIYTTLYFLTNVDNATKQSHIDDIKRKYSNETTNIKTSDSEGISNSENERNQERIPSDNTVNEDLICPRCGSQLIKRVCQKGENIGKEFYGCSNFPHCRYIRNIEEK